MESKICLIGDIVVDVTLKKGNQDTKLRLGGIVHAARALWALNVPYSVAYFAPSYLDEQIRDYLHNINCIDVMKLGNVTGAPYVFLVEDAKESGNQGYEFLLRDEIRVEYFNIDDFLQKKFSDYIFISGNYDAVTLINQLHGNIHIDATNNVKDFTFFKNLTQKVTTFFLSTSSDIFKDNYTDSFEKFVDNFTNFTETIVLKENRGGSRGYSFIDKKIIYAPSQTQPILHSVGVGDAYCATYVSYAHSESLHDRMALASWIALEYALTTYPDDFRTSVSRIISTKIDELVKLPGVVLPWEDRLSINIYIAAPDFDFVDKTHIDRLFNNLVYHNFSPKRPIQENGQMPANASKAERQTIFSNDMILLNQCDILIAVLVYNDPGTLIEIGIASAMGMPVIVYDPNNIADNCMLTELPQLVTNDLDMIISEVFIQSKDLLKHG